MPPDWKAIGGEDPTLGVPTAYYGPGVLQPGTPVAGPLGAHRGKLAAIRAVSIAVEQVTAKFKYGGNVYPAHRRAVAERLSARRGPGDEAAAGHLRRRLMAEESGTLAGDPVPQLRGDG
ncbi:MAG: hypothetical protein M3Y91_16085 [Actinomycetota bacterium]|nr:hypothetical protein [Actinomycetota bacterium]